VFTVLFKKTDYLLIVSLFSTIKIKAEIKEFKSEKIVIHGLKKTILLFGFRERWRMLLAFL